ncbi:hypothetical protein PPERSA_05972 [Pseudocohnilembus persalinus]|uniref:Transmembrane protein n=1 Tax=Pseudocohnilembus persalinus TaxID=266149 RepID=A0A0V0R4A0_PSEPJ|nr:hypothetical protein PPERSA_05972 [Pseudocohnilembus persalinus]|eukprot:KRX09303.1 hypothetical protein PPERSA_05972 [Pseudocohnilembus persalinus]
MENLDNGHIQFSEELANFASILLSSLNNYPKFQLITVMIIIPVILNTVCYWVTDNLLREQQNDIIIKINQDDYLSQQIQYIHQQHYINQNLNCNKNNKNDQTQLYEQNNIDNNNTSFSKQRKSFTRYTNPNNDTFAEIAKDQPFIYQQISQYDEEIEENEYQDLEQKQNYNIPSSQILNNNIDQKNQLFQQQ